MRDYPDGVWFVDLGPLADPTLVARTVAVTLEVQEDPTRPLVAALTATIARLRILLVLDNCEHLLEACATLAATLLRTTAGLRILATSREPLGLTAERVYRVPPLPTSEPSAALTPEQLLQLASVRLLLERATTQAVNIATPGNAHALAEICWRLDGLPLALELAAARLTSLGPAQLATRLDDALDVLSVGPRDAPERQHTLRAALAWSCGLLSAAEQRLFARLAVFAGGWTLEACEGVVGGDGIEPSSVLDLLSGLMAKSLVVAAPGPTGALRYRLLETVRQYARELLDRSGELSAVGTRHSEWFVARIERAFPTGHRPLGSAGQLAPMDADLDNLRLALDAMTSDPGRFDRGLHAAGRLWWFWFDRGRRAEGREYLERLLARADAATSPESRAEALCGAGMIEWGRQSAASLLVARGLLEEAVAIQRECDDNAALARALVFLAHPVKDLGDPATARRLLHECLELAEAVSDRQTQAQALLQLGMLAHKERDFTQATGYYEHSLSICREIGDGVGAVMELGSLAR
jgi:predicted ATPase